MAEVETASERCPRCDALSFQSAKYCSDCGTALSDQKLSTGKIAGDFLVNTAREVGTYTQTIVQDARVRSALNNKTVQKAAAGAAVGAAIFSVIPFVSAGMGAIIGGGLIAYRRLLRQDSEK